MISARPVVIASLLFGGLAAASYAQPPDDSADAAAGFSVDKLETTVRFATDGTAPWPEFDTDRRQVYSLTRQTAEYEAPMPAASFLP